MQRVQSVSVLICSYNRGLLLAETLGALSRAALPPGCDVEVMVVDNNSTDDTAGVVARAAAKGPLPVRYVREPRQGKSFALNTGMETARGDVIALTDDDVLPAADWLVRIVENFRTHDDIVFVFGKVLPRWEVPPPPEMLTLRARDIWGPLALIDYGDDLIRSDSASFGRSRLPIGANLAIRRSAIEAVGGWRTDLGKVDNTLIAGEDHELCVRLYRAGLYSGVYDPSVAVRHLVPASRLRRDYFRRWFYWHGRTMARMADAIYFDLDLTQVPAIFGVPRFVYREFLQQLRRWCRRAGRADALALLAEEVMLIEYLGFFAESWRRRPVSPPESRADGVRRRPGSGHRKMTTADRPDISVVLSTYNRADRLPRALDALLAQTGGVAYEILVIDNNSSDATAAVVSRIIPNSGGRLRYAFEPRQGLSYGRNAGIALARAPLIAFCDDDVRVAPDWIAQLRRTFDAHPDVDYVGGRVLPHWLAQPPAWLTQAHWAPLALQDYGGDPLVSGRDRAVCLVGANLAFRRRVFETVGVFTPSLGRVKDGIGSTEDHDMQLRAWRAGLRGLYVPALVALADVTPDRLERPYHRRWHRGHGRHCALMRLRELVPADLGPMSEPTDLVMLFGSPAFVYTELLRTGYNWARALCRREDPRFYSHQLHHVWSYIRTRQQIFAREASHLSVAKELFRFARAYRRKRRQRALELGATEPDPLLQSHRPRS